MSVIIGADIVPTQSNFELFNNGNIDALIGKELKDVLNNADYRIFNLEIPLVDNESPINKNGPALIAPTSTINGYKALNVDLLTIANNHILDQGESGFSSTLNVLNENKVAFVGGGKNLAEASKSFIFEHKGKKIGVYACAEHEFSIATEKTCGANPFDPLESFDHIVELQKQSDYIIVLYHGGKEHYRYPSPNLQKICRKFIEKGANLVVCQHSHCIGCKEDYQNGTIVYGQGNFLFDHSKSEFWQTSLLVQINDDFTIDYIPLIKVDEKVRLAELNKAKDILSGFEKRTKEIQTEGFIENKYSEFAKTMIVQYLATISLKNKSLIFRVINKISKRRFSKWYFKRKFKKENLLAINNYIECEAHRELFLKGIEIK